MNLVIVESPAKAQTIKKYLGMDFEVYASYGHIRDLPKKELGVDLGNGFLPKYQILPKSKKIIAFLKKKLLEADKIYFATDYDREGEAIAWHLNEVLKPKLKSKRITFVEITKEAVLQAIKHPREIDLRLVDAQQARRVLDRLVGYSLSPLLWKKVAAGLSAGRVQSVALRLIVEREREIKSFVPEEFWQIRAKFEEGGRQFEGLLKMSIKTETDANQVLDDLKNAKYQVSKIEEKTICKAPPPPFITSTLQQEAFRRFGFSAKKTMFLAQQLYEEGYITYHRTDSTNLSEFALKAIRDYLQKHFSPQYLPKNLRLYKTKVIRAQEAHEAIRPTDINRSNISLSADHQKLYELIWRRTLACQMSDAELETIKVWITAKGQNKEYLFLAEGQSLLFDGFLKVYPISLKEVHLPSLKINQFLNLIKLEKEQHFTQPPARYTEATLIKALEKEGIGRPSTYAVILSTILERGYVKKYKQYLYPQEIGFAVNDLLVEHFPDVVDLKFTAKMERELDQIAEGKKVYQQVCQDFWVPFSKNLAEKEKVLVKKEITQQETEMRCEKCGGKMVIQLGRYGRFLRCENFPTCKNKKPLLLPTGLPCPKCQKGEIIERENRRGQRFYGCSRYPECDWAANEIPPQNLSQENDLD